MVNSVSITIALKVCNVVNELVWHTVKNTQNNKSVNNRKNKQADVEKYFWEPDWILSQ